MDPGRRRSISVGDRIQVQRTAQILQRKEALCSLAEPEGQLRGTPEAGGPFGVRLGCAEHGQRLQGLHDQFTDGTWPIAGDMA